MSILLTTIQAAEYIGISPALMKKMRADGKGPRFYRIGKLIKYSEDNLDTYVESLTKYPK